MPKTEPVEPTLSLDLALDGLGMNTGFSRGTDGEMKLLAKAGFKLVRVDLSWEWSERKPGIYSFEQWDRLLESVKKDKLKAIFILAYKNPNYDQNLNPYTDEGRQAFANWAVAAVNHFKGRGILWEIYNEANNELFWKPKPNTQDYIKLATVTCEAIRKIFPNEIMIGPAPAGGIIWSSKFLEECFAGGLLKYFSAITIHPYRDENPETVAGEYRRLRVLIDRYAPAGKHIPIWSGEWGYSNIGEKKNLKIDELTQARFNIRITLTNILCDVPMSIWYDWNDKNYGVVTQTNKTGSPATFKFKKSYDAATVMGAQLQGLRFNKRLWTGDKDVYLLLFSGDKINRMVAWTTSRETKEIILPQSGWNALGLYGNQLPSIAGKKIVVNQDPLYLTPKNPASSILSDLTAWPRPPASTSLFVQRPSEMASRLAKSKKAEISLLGAGLSGNFTWGEPVILSTEDVELPVDLTLQLEDGSTWTQRTWIVVSAVAHKKGFAPY